MVPRQSFSPLIYVVVLAVAGLCRADEPIDIGSRRELFVDDYLIDRLEGVELELQEPVRREVVFETDAPWEGNGSCYQSIVRDGDRYLMYYRGGHHVASRAYQEKKNSWETLCVAESRDGIHWTRPELGIIEFEGSTKNNLILNQESVAEIGGSPAHTATFLDTNPDCPASERFKIVIVGSKPKGLYLLVSEDGFHFRLKSRTPSVTRGAFDSQNLMFWDSTRQSYREYHRSFSGNIRVIMTAESPTLDQFPDPQPVQFPGAIEEALYTNQIQPYFRAPHILMGFPMRYSDRGWSPSMKELPNLEEREFRSNQSQRYGTAVTDALFMTSRDGVSFHRWGEAFLRPGPSRKDTWVYGDNFIFWGMMTSKSSLEEAPEEISLLATEGYWEGDRTTFRRYTLRMDGFVSAHAPLSGGRILTKPLTFSGTQLEMNFATSGAGAIRVEIQDEQGQKIDGFSLADCDEQFGDTVSQVVTWKGESNIQSLSGKPVRLLFEVKDADLYSFRMTAAGQ